jgi:hypothetical protein
MYIRISIHKIREAFAILTQVKTYIYINIYIYIYIYMCVYTYI